MVACTLAFTITPFKANAADVPDTCPDGCTAYIWNGDGVVPLKTTTSENPKFTALGLTSTNLILLRDSTGQLWRVSDGFELSKYLNIGIGVPNNSIFFPSHAARGSATGVSATTGVIDGKPITDTNKPSLPSANYVTVDSSGRLWYAQTNNSNTTPTVAQDSDSIEFMDVAGGGLNINGSVSVSHYIVLLGQPRKQTPQTVINQMPTTGAPEGLSSAGIIAFGIGLAGIMLTLARRRN